jgi:hypothetical protein
MSWRGVSTATPQQADSTSKPGLRANRARPLHRLGLARAASPRNRATARSTAPRRLRWLGIASSPLKLQRIRRPHEPKPFGPALKHLYLFRGHAGCGPPAYLPGRLLMPQATEKARNVPDQRLAAHEPAITHDDARESFASVGSPDLVVSGRVSFNIFGFRLLGGQLDD